MPTHRSNGFTLIELIIVIVILGILSVTAVPRFMDMSEDAHESVFKTAFSSFHQGMEQARYSWILKGQPSGTDALNLMGDLDFNSNGYPTGTDDGTAVGSPQDCEDIFNAVVATSFELESGTLGQNFDLLPNTVDFAITFNNRTCYFTYVAPSKAVGYNARQFRYITVSGEVINWPAGFTLN